MPDKKLTEGTTPIDYEGTLKSLTESYYNALDLINRQKAEIERLKGMVSQNEGVLPRYEQLIKAEAYKECIEKVKDEKFKTSVDAYTDAYILGEDDLDNLLKELVGDNCGV